MSNSDILSDLAHLKDALQSWHSPTITGGQLFYLMQSVTPQLDFREVVGIRVGPGALTRFAETYLADSIKRIGNQGGDILYNLVDREQPGHDFELAAVWKTFVSPSSANHIVLDLEKQVLTSRSTPATEGANEVEIEKASTEEHDDIRSKFVESLPSHEAETFTSHLPDGASFTEWMDIMKAKVPEAVRKWGAFRKDHLSALFLTRLEALDLEQEQKDNFAAQVKASQRVSVEQQKAKRASTGGATTRQEHTPSPPQRDATALQEVRKIAHAAIDEMGYEELRSMRIPLGMIIDSLKAQS